MRLKQNPDITGRDFKLLAVRVKKSAPGPVEAFKQHGVDLVDGMNAHRGASTEIRGPRREIVARDREVRNSYSKGLPGDGDSQRP
ncbi:hypothetical protein [Rhodococcus jostii]|uniref:hypothetical protein n=1 Tax=Rhodococcus jostii TaxID=132919 RepID=UPI0036297927